MPPQSPTPSSADGHVPSRSDRAAAERQVRIVRYILIFVALALLIPLGIGLFG